MAGKKCWWNTDLTDDIEIITSNYPPLDQSSPKADRFEELDHITDDLEDSIMRLDTKKLPKYHMDEFNLEKAFELPEPSPSIVESTLDERGRKVTVTEDVSSAFSGSRSRSRTPFKIRDNISHLLGWDKLEDQDPEYDETISKLGISGSLQKDKIHFSKLSYRKPCSRLALLDNDQVSAFNFELRLIRNHITDFPLNFPWVVWVSKESKTEWKTIIGNKIDFKSATKFIKSIYTDCKIMVFKLGVLPKRKNAENIDSISIDIQVSHDNDYDAFKQILYTCLDGNLYSPDIDLTICGVAFKRKPSYSIISCWIHSPLERFDDKNIFDPVLVFNLVEALRGHLEQHLQSIVDTAVIVEHKTLHATALYL